MCLAQGPQSSDTGEAGTRGPSVSSQALYHYATALPKQELCTHPLGDPSKELSQWDMLYDHNFKLINLANQLDLWFKHEKPRNKARSQCLGQSDSKWYAPLCHPKRNHHPKFGIPTSNNIGDMLWTQQFLKLGQRSRSQWPKNGLWHSGIPRCIYIPNLELLFQRI